MSAVGRPRRVLVVDDHSFVRAGVRVLLDHSPFRYEVGEASTGSEALLLLREQEWDAIILDLTLPDRDGIQLLVEIHSQYESLPILILSGHVEIDYAVRALRHGAKAYVNKGSAMSQLLVALDRAFEGKRYFPPDFAEQLAEELLTQEAAEGHDLLSERELEILQLIASGKGNSDIGEMLFISVKTVSTHRTNILKKLGLNNTAELIRYALRHHLAT